MGRHSNLSDPTVGTNEGDFNADHRTLSRVMGCLDRLGVTRLGDLTGLDTLGVPVWFACRPNSRSLSVAQGKGLTDTQARLSAIMEAAEQHYAERDDLGARAITGSLDELRAADQPVVPLDRLADCTIERFDAARSRRWLAGTNLFDDRLAHAPLDLIAMDYRTASPYDRTACRMTSVGLGAGTTRIQAILHALLEVIENGATALIESLGPLPALRRDLVIARGEDASLDILAGKLGSAGVAARLFQVHHSLDIPVIGAVVEGPRSGSSGRLIGSFVGYACHPNPLKAATAALLEAIQSRLTDIAGARDDILPEDYARNGVTLRQTAPDCSSIGQAFGPGRPRSCDPTVLLDSVKNRLRNAGIKDIFVFDLGGSEIGACVVKVLATDFDNAGDDPIIDIGLHGLESIIGIPGKVS